MSEHLFAKTPAGALKPTDERGEEVLRKVRVGTVVRVKITRPRNPRHHRLLFAILRIVMNHTTAWQKEEDVLFALKMATGMFDMIPTANGPVPRVHSISFDAMDQGAFEIAFDRFCDVITTKVIPGLPTEQLKREVEDMIEPTPVHQSSRPKRSARR